MSKAKNATLMDTTKMLGDEAMKIGRNTYLFGLGAVVTAEEEMRGVIDRMVQKGEGAQKDDALMIGKATGKVKEFGHQVEEKVESTVSATLNRAGIPNRGEIRTLIMRVEELTEKVDALAAR
ncbi:MAG: phasin family protein [bacterium]|nr:phasin family protein [bacterium]